MTDLESSANPELPVEAKQSDLELLGGEPKLRAIISDFVDLVRGDFLIGYLFERAEPERLKQLEFEFAQLHLGGGQPYTGRGLRAAHGPLRIKQGEFHRRAVLLEQVLKQHQVPAVVQERWLAHLMKLKPLVLGGAD